MMELNEEVIRFLQNQSFVIISTVDGKGRPHTACKGIVEINSKGEVYLLDLYLANTYRNLKKDPYLSITAVDEHRFCGYCLKGKARIINQEDISPEIMKAWEDKVTSRITQRVLKNILDKKGHPEHPEAAFPKPKYMIVVEIDSIEDLTPRHLK